MPLDAEVQEEGGEGGETSDAPEAPDAPASAAETWLECEDDQGNVYYYNQDTGESAWTLPEGEVVATVVPLTLVPADTRRRLELLDVGAPADLGPGSPSERQASIKGDDENPNVVLEEEKADDVDGGQGMASGHEESAPNDIFLRTEPSLSLGGEGEAIDTDAASASTDLARYRKESLARLSTLRGERDGLAQERDGLAHKLVATQAALQKAQQTVSNLESQLQEATKRDETIIAELRKEFEDLSASNAQYAEYARVSAANLEMAQTELRQLRESNELLLAAQKQSVQETSDLRAQITATAAEAQVSTGRLSEANEELSRDKTDLARAVDELKRDNEDLKRQLEVATREKEDQAQQAKRCEILLAVAKEETSQEIAKREASAREQAATECQNALAQATGALRSQIQIAQEDHTRKALSKVADLLSKHHSREGSFPSQHAAFSTQQAQLDALATTIRDLQERLAGANERAKELEETANGAQALRQQVDALSAQVSGAAAHTEAAVSESETRSKRLEAELNAAIDEVEASKVRESKLEAQVIKLRAKVQDLEAGNIQVPQYDPALTKELSEAQNALASTQNELGTTKKDLESLHVRLEELQASETRLRLELDNTREELVDAAQRTKTAEDATKSAQAEAQALQGAAEEALAEVHHANNEATEMHDLLETERRRHFQERTALLSELDLHKCAASARASKRKALATQVAALRQVRERIRQHRDDFTGVRTHVAAQLSQFAETLQIAKRDLAERTFAIPLAPETDHDDDVTSRRQSRERAMRDLEVSSIESSAISPDPACQGPAVRCAKRKVMAFCRIHPRICHILNSSVIMANKETLELCNSHGHTRRWALSGLADSYVKNQQTFDALRLSAFCYATDPESAYCAILHGQRQAAPELSLLGDLSDPGLLAQTLYALVQQLGFSNHDLALEVCSVDARSSQLVFRAEGIACKSVREAQLLVDSLPVNQEGVIAEGRPCSATSTSSKGKKIFRKKSRRLKKARGRSKASRNVVEGDDDPMASSILENRVEDASRHRRSSGDYYRHRLGSNHACIGDDDEGENEAHRSAGNVAGAEAADFRSKRSSVVHEVFTILVNEHPRIQFVVLSKAIGSRPARTDLLWTSNGQGPVTPQIPAEDSVMGEIVQATRAWQRGQSPSGRHPILNQLYFLHAPAATVQLVTHITQGLKDADQSLLHLESARAFLASK